MSGLLRRSQWTLDRWFRGRELKQPRDIPWHKGPTDCLDYGSIDPYHLLLYCSYGLNRAANPHAGRYLAAKPMRRHTRAVLTFARRHQFQAMRAILMASATPRVWWLRFSKASNQPTDGHGQLEPAGSCGRPRHQQDAQDSSRSG